jgi:hypothetical protein
MKKIVAVILTIVLLAAGLTSWYVFFKPHRSLESSAVTSVSADALLRAYQQDEALANTQYLDKALEVRGKITDINTNLQGQMVLVLDTGDPMAGIVCTLDQAGPELEKGQEVLVRGFCSGYLSDVVLRNVILVKP